MQIKLHQQGPGGMPQRLTNAAANQSEAEAYRSSDPRAMAKSFERKGFSRGAGQYSLGGVQGARNYTANMAQSQATRMNDAFGNANQQLGETSRNEQFGTALAGLAENDRNDRMSSLQDGYNMLNGLFGGFGGSRPR